MKRSLIAVGAAIAAIALAPLTQADGDGHGYYQYLNARGMMGSGPGQYDPDYLVRQGNSVCASFQQGGTDESVADQLEAQLPVAVAGNIVYAARHYLCP